MAMKTGRLLLIAVLLLGCNYHPPAGFQRTAENLEYPITEHLIRIAKHPMALAGQNPGISGEGYYRVQADGSVQIETSGDRFREISDFLTNTAGPPKPPVEKRWGVEVFYFDDVLVTLRSGRTVTTITIAKANDAGWTLLHEAVVRADQTAVMQLLASNAVVNAKDRTSWAPLHYAVHRRQKDIVRLLLTNKADANVRDLLDRTPLHLADDEEVVRMLLACGADVNARDRDLRTPLHHATSFRDEMAELLLTNKAEVNARDKHGVTPLHLAARRSSGSGVVLLLANKAEVNARDSRGRTPLQYAIENRCDEVVKLLQQRGGRE